MDRRRFLGMAALTAGAVGAAAGAAAASASDAPPGTAASGGAASGGAVSGGAAGGWRLGDTAAGDSPQAAAERVLAERLAARTGGRHTLTVLPPGALGDHHRLLEQVRAGTLTMTRVRLTDLAVFDPRLALFGLPYLAADPTALLAALEGRLGDEVAAGLAGADLAVLGFLDGGTRNLATAGRPVRRPGDLRGLRLAAPAPPAMAEAVAALGAEPVALAPTAVAAALRAGRLDGAESDVGHYAAGDLAAAAPTWSWTRHRVDVDVLLAGRRWWRALPAADREAVAGAASEAAAHQRELVTARADRLASDLAAARATTVDGVDVAAFRAALLPLLDRYRAGAGELGRLLP